MNELSEKALEVLNEVAGCRYKKITSATSSEMLLAGEIIRLQIELEKAQNIKQAEVVSFTEQNQLHEVANNKFLRKYMMVCFWENGAVSAGWGGVEEIDFKDLSFGLNVMENRAKNEMFPKGNAT